MGRVAVALVAAAVLAVPGAASAETIHLDWQERAVSGQETVLTIRVGAVAIGSGGWAASVSFRNTAKATIAIRRQFALVVATSLTPSRGVRVLPASEYEPALAARLRPGRFWVGVVRGTGEPPRGAFVRLSLGFFVVPFRGLPGFSWVTRHAFRF